MQNMSYVTSAELLPGENHSILLKQPVFALFPNLFTPTCVSDPLFCDRSILILVRLTLELCQSKSSRVLTLPAMKKELDL
eukprot:scaffold10339_cov174-Amphora_coffeaeformis.AAC.2